MKNSGFSRLVLLALFAIPLSLSMALIVGPVLRDGMFIDGLVYTNIAKNLADNHGSIWEPVVDVGGPEFYGHPALLPYLQSYFFRLLGTQNHVEDIYNLFVFAATLWLICLIWKESVSQKNRLLCFFPMLLFVLSQEVQLRYPNTMLECGMTAILLLGTYLYCKFRSKPLLASGAVGVTTFLAFLSKGPVGMFLLVLPVFWEWFENRRLRLLYLLLPTTIFLGCGAMLAILQPQAVVFFESYLNTQLFPALKGEALENLRNTRWGILHGLVMLNIPAIISCLLVWFINSPSENTHRNRAWAFLLIGFAAIVPITFSLKQASYYQIPSLPYFCLGLSLLLVNKIRVMTTFITSNRRLRKGLIVFSTLAVISTTFYALSLSTKTDRRDVAALHQAAQIDYIMDSVQVSSYNFQVVNDSLHAGSALSYSLPGFLNRFHNIYRDHTDNSFVTLTMRSDSGFPAVQPNETVLLQNDTLLLTIKANRDSQQKDGAGTGQ